MKGTAALLLACLGWWVGPAAATQPPASATPGFRHVTGRVVDERGGAVAGATVSLFREVVLSGEDGGFLFPNVSMRHLSEVSLRVRSARTGYVIGCITIDVPVRFYPVAASHGDGVAHLLVDMAEERPLELKLRPVGAAAIDGYCHGCHGVNPCTEEATYETVIKTGKDLRGIIVDDTEVEAYKKDLMTMGLSAETYRKIRYQDTHPDGMNMAVIPTLELSQYKGRFKWPENLKLRDEAFVTCDTCHTRHVPTAQKHFLVVPYEEGNELCYMCHL